VRSQEFWYGHVFTKSTHFLRCDEISIRHNLILTVVTDICHYYSYYDPCITVGIEKIRGITDYGRQSHDFHWITRVCLLTLNPTIPNQSYGRVILIRELWLGTNCWHLTRVVLHGSRASVSNSLSLLPPQKINDFNMHCWGCSWCSYGHAFNHHCKCYVVDIHAVCSLVLVIDSIMVSCYVGFW